MWRLKNGSRKSRWMSLRGRSLFRRTAHVYFSYGDEMLYDPNVDAGTVGRPIEFEDDIGRVASPSGMILALDLDDNLYIFGLPTGETSEIDLGIGSLGRTVFSPIGGDLAVGRGDVIEIYNLLSGEMARELDSGVSGSNHNGLAFSPNGSLLARHDSANVESAGQSGGRRQQPRCGVTRECIRQIEAKALRKLRHLFKTRFAC